MALRPDNKILYTTFRSYMDRCLLHDKSLIWPNNNLWNLENLQTVKKRLIDSPIMGRALSFEEKLTEQMKGAQSSLWGIISDIYCIYFLPSTFISFEKKKKDLEWAADKGGLQLLQADNKIWDALNNGFTRTSMKYHTKYGQFWLILLFAIYVKEHDIADSVIRESKIMQDTLDTVIKRIEKKTDRAYDIRHAMLYMAFPEDYERIISTKDKQLIVDAFKGQISDNLPSDLDESIRLIRKRLASKYDKKDRPFDWYQDLKEQWRTTDGNLKAHNGGKKNPIDSKNDTNKSYQSYSIEDLENDTGIEISEIERWKRAVSRKKQIIFYGPPGTGKTFIAEKFAQHLISKTDGFAEILQFHPAYAYEDFIQGIRPNTKDDGNLVYKTTPGRFLEFCKEARSRKGPCVLIIDEINRANLARVFGELMYLLEYRDKEVPLAGGGELSIPENALIIGTMNTADRSIALVDHALRRRFAFIALSPNYDILTKYQEPNGFNTIPLITVLKKINRQIDDPHYEIGIAFFLKSDLKNQLPDIWKMEIEPYLEEYFFDQKDKVETFRWGKIRESIL